MFVILLIYCALLIDIVVCRLASVVDSNTDSDSALCRSQELLRLCNDGV